MKTFMKTVIPVVLAVLVAVSAVPIYAQPAADFSVMLERGSAEGSRLPDRIAIGETLVYRINWHIAGTVAPSDVVLEVDVPGVVVSLFKGRDMSCTTEDPVRCTFSALNDADGSMQIGVRIDTPGMHTTVARAIHQGSPDSNSSNDSATHTFEAVALPSIKLIPGLLPNRLEPGQRGTFAVTARNFAATPATNVVLTITLPTGGTLESGGTSTNNASCAVANNALVCTLASLSQDQLLAADVVFTAPWRTTGEYLFVAVTITSTEQDLDPLDNEYKRSVMMPRQFVVENVEDQGSGSLRQAIRDLNTLCSFNAPCEIAFRIPAPVPDDGWFTIQPHSPLPEISGSVRIDGRTQTAFTGDTNSEGPEIEINGALVYEQSGLRLRPNCAVEVRNLAVNGFPGYGIEVRRLFEGFGIDRCIIFSQLRLAAAVTENYLGTDARGRDAKPNQRGLGIFTVFSRIIDNLIGGNRRAGIYSTDSYFTEIRGNRIGIGTDGASLGNGAGIFFDIGENLFGSPPGADVVENVIANNNGMAIARTRRGEIFITDNSIFDNLLQGIDVDLDAASPNRDFDNDVPNRPVLFSATYDPVQNATIIRGRLDSNAGPFTFQRFMIEVYASSRLSVWGYPQAERSLKQQVLDSGHQDFEIVVPQDLRGQWITAAHTVSRYVGFVTDPRKLGTQSHASSFPGNTSELSDEIAVR